MTDLEWNAHLRKVAQHAVQAVRECYGRPFDSQQDSVIAIHIERLLGEIGWTIPILEPAAIGSQPDSETSEAVANVAAALAKPVAPERQAPEEPSPVIHSPQTEQKEAA